MEIRKNYYLKIWLMILLVCIFAEIGYGQNYLSTDKGDYGLNEAVNIYLNITNYTNIKLSVTVDGGVYNYLDTLNPLIIFSPKKEGVYFVKLTNSSDLSIIDKLNFTVGQAYLNEKSQAPANMPAEAIANNSIKVFIATNKDEYKLGEEILLEFSSFLSSDYKVVIESFGSSYKFLGETQKQIKFVPNEIGIHSIKLFDGNNFLIESKDITVIDKNIKATNIVISLENSKRDKIEADVGFYKKGVLIKEIKERKGIFGSALSENTIQEDTYDVEVAPINSPVKKIKISNLRFNGSISLGIDDVPEKIKGIGKKNVLELYAIDASGTSFSNGIISAVAKGTELYKCRDWNFTEQRCYGSWNKIMDLIPGKEYNVTITPEDPGYAETGLASINTNKSIYNPFEEAKIIMAVLDKDGRLVSGADVILNVTKPDNSATIYSTTDSTITEKERGIYEAIYSNADLEGNYSLFVKAVGNNVVSSMFSFFTVKQFYEFDILRQTPVTTDPWQGAFTSSIKIVSLMNETIFDFTEVLPINFTITDNGGSIESISGNKKILKWQNLANNSIVSYSANPPLITPELYELGQSYVNYGSNTFTEARAWFLAVDPHLTAPPNVSGMFAYMVSSDAQFPRYRIWNSTNLGEERNATTITSILPNWLVMRSNPIRDEFVLAVLDDDGDINAQVWNSTNWTNLRELATAVTAANNNFKAVDIAYEQSSGRAMVVFDNGTVGSIIYNIWNGTGWSANSSFIDTNDGCAGATRWVRAEPRPNSNDIAVVIQDANGDLCAHIWNGTAWWQNKTIDTTNGPAGDLEFDVAFEQQSGDIMVAWDSDAIAGVMNYCEYNQSIQQWCNANNSLEDRGTANTFVKIASMPNSDRLMMGVHQTGNDDVEAVEWSGTKWGAWALIDDTVNTVGDRAFDVAYIGSTGNAMVVYVDETTGIDNTNFSTCAGGGCASGAWTDPHNTTNPSNNCGEAVDLEFISLDSDPFSNKVMMTAVSQTTHFKCAQEYNGASWLSWFSALGSGANQFDTEAKAFKYNAFRDTTKPSVNFVFPTLDNNTLIGVSYIYINATAYDQYGISICTLEWQNANESLNLNEIGDRNAVCFLNKTGLSDGTYTYKVWANDSAKNSNSTELRQVRVDLTKPVINITSVAPNPANITFNNVTVNWTASDLNLNVSFVNVSYPNGSLLGIYFTNFTLTTDNLTVVGNYTLTGFANDSVGFTNLTVTILTVNDTIVPGIILISPENQSFDNDGNINFTFNISDHSEISSCELLFSDSVSSTNSSINKSLTQRFVNTSLNDGVYSWNINCTDAQGNENKSLRFEVTVDKTSPSVTLEEPINNTFDLDGSLNMSYTAVDSFLSACQLFANFSGIWKANQTNSTPSSGVKAYFNATALNDGLYIWNVYCNDSASNIGYGADNFTINVDTKNPRVNFTAPTPANETNTTSTTILINVTHNEENPDTIILDFNGTLTIKKYSGNDTNFTLANLQGVYFYNASLNDTAGRTNKTETRKITVDSIPPRLFLEAPLNDTWSTSNVVIFRYNVSDETLGIKNCSLHISNALNQTNTSVQQGVSQNFTTTIENTNGIEWFINCTDYLSNFNKSEVRLIKVDNSFPTIINISINATSIPINRKICLNATVNDTFSSISFVYAEIKKPVSVNPINVSLVNDTANPNNCGNAKGNVWSYALLNDEEGQYNWTATYARDIAGNLNSTKIFGMNWSAFSSIFTNTSMHQPLSNFKINESNLEINYSFEQRCNVTCRDDSTDPCDDVTLFAQYNNGTWNDITNFTSQLINAQMNKSCGNIAIGSHCNATFNISTSRNSGNKNFTIRCKALSSTAPVSVSQELNLTVNDYPVAAFAFPQNGSFLNNIEMLNASASADDINLSRFAFELDDSNAFSSSSLLCDNNQSNCTFNTLTQAQCIEDTWDCYIRLNVTDSDSLKNSTYIQIQIDNTNPSVRLDAPANDTWSNNATINFNYTAFDTNLQACILYHNETGAFARNETNSTVRNNTLDAFTINLANGKFIWNVLCNDSAGNSAFNNTNFTINVDAEKPNITFSGGTEANNTFFNRNYIFVNVSVSDSNPVNLSFYLYNSSLDLVNRTTYQAFNNSNSSINFTNLADINERYYYNATIIDRANNENSTETRVITLDAIGPKINFSNNTEANNTFFNRNYIFVNVSVNETNFANITFYLYNSNLNLVNETNFTTLTDFINFSNLQNLDMLYYYNVTVRDKVGFENSTETRIITLDSIAPAVALNLPPNKTQTTNSSWVFNYTPSDTNLKNCSLYANFSGTFAENLTNISPANNIYNIFAPTAIPDGLYVWNVRCHDRAGNSAFNDTNYTLEIDSTPPSAFELSFPPHNTESINRSPLLNWTQTADAHFLNYTVLVDNDADFSSVNFQYAVKNNVSNTTIPVNDLWDGNTKFYWKVIAYDTFNLSRNSTSTFTYIIDNGTPQISLISPDNNSEINVSLIDFKFNVTDANTVSNCSLILSNEIRSTLQSPAVNTTLTISINLANNNYNWSINCTDKAGNINNSEFRNLTVNNIPLEPPPTTKGILAYREGITPNFIKHREWNYSDFTAEINGPNVVSTLTNWVVMRSNPTRDEMIMAVLDDDGDVNAMVWNSTNWSNPTEMAISIDATNNNFKGVDVAYEQLSGRGIIALNNGSSGYAVYRLWNGSAWNSSNINMSLDGCTGIPRWIRLEAKPNSNEIVYMEHDSLGSFCTWVWNGTEWWNNKTLETTAASTTQQFDIVYERSSRDIMAAWESSLAGAILACNYTDNQWCDAPINLTDRGSANTWLRMAAMPTANKIMLATFHATDNDVEAIEWSGSGWGTWGSVNTNTEPGDRDFDVSYIGSTGDAMVATVTSGQDYPRYSTCIGADCSAGTWSPPTATTSTTNNCGEAADLEFISLDSDPLSSRVMLTALSQTNHFKCAQEYNGSEWGFWWSNLASGRNLATSEEKTFRYNPFRDTDKPNIDFVAPTPLNRTFVSANYVYVNVSAFDEYKIKACTLDWNGTNESMLITRDGKFAACSVNKTNLAEGNYTFRAYANDTSNNINSTETRLLIIDTISPNVTLITPLNDSVESPVPFVIFEYIPLDVNLKNCSLYANFSGTFAENLTNISPVISGQVNNFTVSNISVGKYVWNVLCYDLAGNFNFSKSNFTFLITGDLSINSTNIKFSKGSPAEFDNVTINATIQNIGDKDEINAIIQFFESNIYGESQLGSNKTINISKRSNASVTVDWIAKQGNTTIIVIIDPPFGSGVIEESNEENNKANNSIFVGSYHIYYGDITIDTVLDTSQNLSVLAWLNDTTAQANVLAVDSDSSISLSTLQALGRNASGNISDASKNDFEELDAALNLTNTTDNINFTWTFQGLPKGNATFTISEIEINFTPVVNSTTNTSSFITGILWDTSDSNPGNYNGSPDVAFVTKINRNSLGAYGAYDFELKVPAQLRRYVNPNSDNSITLLVELI